MARGTVNTKSGGGSPDIHSKTLADYNITYGSIIGTTLADVLNYTGSGWLHSIHLELDDNEELCYLYIEITIDGVLKTSGIWGSSEVNDFASVMGFSSPIYFETSIQVQVTTSKADASAKCVIAWTQDASELPFVKPYLESETKFATAISSLATDIVNVTGSGEFRSVCVSSRNDAIDDIDVTIIIDGVTIYNNELGESRGAGLSGWSGRINMAIPFETSLQIIMNGRGTSAQGYVQYMLDS